MKLTAARAFITIHNVHVEERAEQSKERFLVHSYFHGNSLERHYYQCPCGRLYLKALAGVTRRLTGGDNLLSNIPNVFIYKYNFGHKTAV